MPEAVGDKDGHFLSDKSEIGTARSSFVVKTVPTNSSFPKSAAKGHFRRRVLRLVGAHHSGNGIALRVGRSFVADVIDELRILEGAVKNRLIDLD